MASMNCFVTKWDKWLRDLGFEVFTADRLILVHKTLTADGARRAVLDRIPTFCIRMPPVATQPAPVHAPVTPAPPLGPATALAASPPSSQGSASFAEPGALEAAAAGEPPSAGESSSSEEESSSRSRSRSPRRGDASRRVTRSGA